MNDKCLVEGCARKSRALGYCKRHYERFRIHGHVADTRRPPTPKGGSSPYKWAKNRKTEHVVVVETIIGKSLPPKAVIHHIDGNEINNSPTNLVVCPNQAYHLLLHKRQRAYDACGNPNYWKCPFCKQYDDVANLDIDIQGGGQGSKAHRECKNAWQRDAARRRKLKRGQNK